MTCRATDSEVEEVVKKWFQGACDRDGKRNLRKEKDRQNGFNGRMTAQSSYNEDQMPSPKKSRPSSRTPVKSHPPPSSRTPVKKLQSTHRLVDKEASASFSQRRNRSSSVSSVESNSLVHDEPSPKKSRPSSRTPVKSRPPPSSRTPVKKLQSTHRLVDKEASASFSQRRNRSSSVSSVESN